jgi:hypothetical protein
MRLSLSKVSTLSRKPNWYVSTGGDPFLEQALWQFLEGAFKRGGWKSKHFSACRPDCLSSDLILRGNSLTIPILDTTRIRSHHKGSLRQPMAPRIWVKA